MKKILSMNKKGVLGLDTVRSVMLSLLVLAVVGVAIFLALTSLQTAGIFSTGSSGANNTNYIVNNITYGTTAFFNNTPTFFILLGVVVLILIISMVIMVVSRFGGGGGRIEGL